LYPDLCVRALLSKQLLARPQYNFAGSITMVFASGVGPGAVRRRRDAVCTERVVGQPEVFGLLVTCSNGSGSFADYVDR
jgi:hypothetical protein